MKLEIQAQDYIRVELAINGDCKISQPTEDEEFPEHCIFIAPENIERLCALLMKAKDECIKKRSRILKSVEGSL